MPPRPDVEPILLTARQAARRLGVGDKVFRRLVAGGDIPFALVGRRRMFRVSDLEKFVRRKIQTCPAADPAPSLPATRNRRTGKLTSPCMVVDFEKALRQTTARKPKP